ncbi:hypothetical protein J7T55_006407 [Diaporthe amygdali]|uniref:uncharacterized protein n=1 Tax=Phomopsis amygdali TaxID=1214568 RepID=UPI0022FEBA08|nr:uncharacterized protein J7T55_006407 [Diaporthe amygdali]KAJ0125063.1 hypothetical protein J7T55_006407 [Diaporthe amygdali]
MLSSNRLVAFSGCRLQTSGAPRASASAVCHQSHKSKSFYCPLYGEADRREAFNGAAEGGRVSNATSLPTITRVPVRTSGTIWAEETSASRPKTSRLPSARGQGVFRLHHLGFAASPRLSAPVSGVPAKDILNLNPTCRSARAALAQALGI